jgi:two-component system, chemotaxis family, protein-glutamate methylesterase/glutaminase
MTRKTRILIVDDSVVMRSLLRSVVCSDPELEVAGTAADGLSALKSIALVRPDLILLDVEMPVMDGLATLRQLRANGHRMPVIVCSALTRRGAKVTLDALAEGASDYVAKPSGQSDRDSAIKALAQELVPKMRALTRPSTLAGGTPSDSAVFPAGMQPAHPWAPRIPSAPVVAPRQQSITGLPTFIAIGVSTGGPAALDIVLPGLPQNFPLPVAIVQHMPEVFTRLLAERLNGHCPLRVREAVEGEPALAGSIYIARGDWHLEMVAPARNASPPTFHPTFHLGKGAPESHCRPAADVLFRSVAALYGAGALAVVLTGMGSDGMLGSKMIREQGGTVIAQDQASSTVWGMPGAVSNAGLANRVLDLHAIAPEIVRLALRAASEARELRESAVS